MVWLRLWLCGMALALWPAIAPGQSEDTFSRGVVQSPILTVDSDRLFTESAYGNAVIAEIEAASLALQAENDQISTELQVEEQDLTDKRSELSPAEFKELADAFDEKAQRIRRERAAKARDLTQRLEQERLTFFNSAVPVLEAIMRESGAAVVLEQRSVFISANAIDITEAAIMRIDAVLERQ